MMRSLPILLGLVSVAALVYACLTERLDVVERARAEVERRREGWMQNRPAA